MTVYTTDPLLDLRWPTFLAQQTRSSVFHTPAWLATLRRTYGYEPVVFTTTAPGEELRNGLLFCRVQSWLMGCRMVSVPFSDHCAPLVDNPEEMRLLLSWLRERLDREKWKYIELRPLGSCDFDRDRPQSFSLSDDFYFHRIDLRPELDVLFHNLHKSCVQRKIQRAERERLTYEQGRSQSVLAKFYHLLLLTRRRHKLPPQPIVWFRNLVDCFGDKLTIRVASQDGQPIASILTLSCKKTLIYKYGCSDARFHNLGGMPFLFWRAIQDGKALGAQEFDLGRSDTDNLGLVAFKEHLGAAGSKLSYMRATRHPSSNPVPAWKLRLVRGAFSRIPNSWLKVAGQLLYRHMG